MAKFPWLVESEEDEEDALLGDDAAAAEIDETSERTAEKLAQFEQSGELDRAWAETEAGAAAAVFACTFCGRGLPSMQTMATHIATSHFEMFIPKSTPYHSSSSAREADERARLAADLLAAAEETRQIELMEKAAAEETRQVELMEKAAEKTRQMELMAKTQQMEKTRQMELMEKTQQMEKTRQMERMEQAAEETRQMEKTQRIELMSANMRKDNEAMMLYEADRRARQQRQEIERKKGSEAPEKSPEPKSADAAATRVKWSDGSTSSIPKPAATAERGGDVGGRSAAAKKCPVCQKTFQRLQTHLTRSHKMTDKAAEEAKAKLDDAAAAAVGPEGVRDKVAATAKPVAAETAKPAAAAPTQPVAAAPPQPVAATPDAEAAGDRVEGHACGGCKKKFLWPEALAAHKERYCASKPGAGADKKSDDDDHKRSRQHVVDRDVGEKQEVDNLTQELLNFAVQHGAELVKCEDSNNGSEKSAAAAGDEGTVTRPPALKEAATNLEDVLEDVLDLEEGLEQHVTAADNQSKSSSDGGVTSASQSSVDSQSSAAVAGPAGSGGTAQTQRRDDTWCTLCDRELRSAKELSVHVEQWHRRRESSAAGGESACGVCGKAYAQSVALKYHMQVVHKSAHNDDENNNAKAAAAAAAASAGAAHEAFGAEKAKPKASRGKQQASKSVDLSSIDIPAAISACDSFTCFICDHPHTQAGYLRDHIALFHFPAEIKRDYNCADTKICTICQVERATAGGIVKHIGATHKKILDYLPAELEPALWSSGAAQRAARPPTPTAELGVKTECAAANDDDDEDVEFRFLANAEDKDKVPSETMLHLAELKNIFSHQLPRMPKDYINQLVFDPAHTTLVLVKANKPIGGICFRSFVDRGFSEIAICAVTTSEQVKGFGTGLMNRLKAWHVQQGILHLLTFAAEDARGYFAKQGFRKKIEIEQEKYQGLIKDYEGATLMGCALDSTVAYADLPFRKWGKKSASKPSVGDASGSSAAVRGKQKRVSSSAKASASSSSSAAAAASDASDDDVEAEIMRGNQMLIRKRKKISLTLADLEDEGDADKDSDYEEKSKSRRRDSRSSRAKSSAAEASAAAAAPAARTLRPRRKAAPSSFEDFALDDDLDEIDAVEA